MVSDLMPNAAYHSKAVVLDTTCTNEAAVISSVPAGIYVVSDDGVFVNYSDNPVWPGIRMTESRIAGSGYRTMFNNHYIAAGGINMDTTTANNNLFVFAIVSNDTATAARIRLAGYRGLGVSSSISEGVIIQSPTQGEMGIRGGAHVTITVDKIEICHDQRTYITGLTLVISVNGSYAYRGGMIIARAVPMSGDGFIATLSNGSVIFLNDGKTNGVVSGDNVTLATASMIAQAIPSDAVISNNKMLAVSCMCCTDNYARWLGYKNGIYKIYQGTALHNGMPGEKVTIKGHEFVCLAYGPFYARMT